MVNLWTFLPAGLDKDGPWKNPPGSQGRIIWEWPCLWQCPRGRSRWEHRRAQQVGTQFVFFPGHLEYLHRLTPTQTAQQPHCCVAEFQPGKGPRNRV